MAVYLLRAHCPVLRRPISCRGVQYGGLNCPHAGRHPHGRLRPTCGHGHQFRRDVPLEIQVLKQSRTTHLRHSSDIIHIYLRQHHIRTGARSGRIYCRMVPDVGHIHMQFHHTIVAHSSTRHGGVFLLCISCGRQCHSAQRNARGVHIVLCRVAIHPLADDRAAGTDDASHGAARTTGPRASPHTATGNRLDRSRPMECVHAVLHIYMRLRQFLRLVGGHRDTWRRPDRRSVSRHQPMEGHIPASSVYIIHGVDQQKRCPGHLHLSRILHPACHGARVRAHLCGNNPWLRQYKYDRSQLVCTCRHRGRMRIHLRRLRAEAMAL